MKYVLVSLVSILLFSCVKKECKHTIPNGIVIVPTEVNDGRQMYNVIFEDEKGVDNLYAEEIANGLLTGNWINNEDWKLANASEYQVFLEPDSLMIWDGERKVAAVPYKQIGVLDSVFYKDNE